MSNSENKALGFIEKIRSNKKLQFVIIFAIIVVVIFVLFFNFNDNQTKQETINSDQISTYVSDLEQKLSLTLSKVDGAGKVSTVITVSSGMETVLATSTTTKETANGIEKIETPIIINGKTVIIKEVYPKITGVLIVAQGADNIAVMNKIQQATISLLDIKLEQIEILTMK